jgi:toxin ParE1/3/4
MPSVRRSRLAEADLVAIGIHIGRDNPRAAKRWLDAIEAKFALLASQPLMGEAVDHIRAGLRRLSHGQYVIFFEARDNGIAVIRIVHGARQIENML